MAITVPGKGGTGRFARDECLDFVRECGDQENKIWVKSDQEAGMDFVNGEILEGRTEGRTIEEGVQSSRSNGPAERA
eukprot:12368467-Karenia_brevis.AAC.1